MLLNERPILEHITTEMIESQNSQAPGGIRTHDFLIAGRVLYRCPTIAAQEEQEESFYFKPPPVKLFL